MVVCQLNGNDERVFQEIKSEDEKKKKQRTNAVVAINRVDLLLMLIAFIISISWRLATFSYDFSSTVHRTHVLFLR